MIPAELIEEIKNKINIVDVIGEYVSLIPRGDRFWGLSPFKTEKTPSFSVVPSKKFYYCFSTNKGGDIISFLMEMEGFTYPETLEYLGKKLGIDVWQQSTTTYNDETKNRKAMEELYSRIAETFHFLLTSSPVGKQALEYVKARGFTKETIDHFFLGYAHHDAFWLYAFLKKKGYSEDFLAQTSLFSKKNPQWNLFSRRLVFPIKRHQGEVVGFGGRLLDEDGPKYINSPDNLIFHKRQNLYGIDHAKQSIKEKQSFIICEGYFDVLAFHQSGITNAVAPLGTAFTIEQAKLLHRYAEKGVIIFDGDESGIKAAGKAAIIMEEADLEGDFVSLPPDSDPADILLKKGSQKLQNLLSSSISILDFVLKEAVSIFDITTPYGRERILSEVFPYIYSVNSPVRQEAMLQIVADRISASPRSIYEKFRQNKKLKPVSEMKQNDNVNYNVSPELLLLIALIIHPEYYERLRPEFQKNSIQRADARTLYAHLEEHYRRGNLEFNDILASVEDVKLKKLILKKAASLDEYGTTPEEYEEYIFSSFKRVRSDWLHKRRREIELLMRRKEQDNDQEGLRELVSEKIYIDSEIENVLRK